MNDNLKRKSKIEGNLFKFISFIERRLKELGIVHQTSCRGTPQKTVW
jgi:hypothetical protein